MSHEEEGLAPDPRRHHRPDTHLRRWGAVYLLVLLFLGSWAGQFIAQLIEFRNEQSAHDQPFAWAEFLPTFLASTFENWQSEWFQLVFQAILLMGAQHLIFRVQGEETERIEAKIDEVNRRLDRLAPPEGGAAAHDVVNDR